MWPWGKMDFFPGRGGGGEDNFVGGIDLLNRFSPDGLLVVGEHDAMYLCELCCTEGPCGSVFAHIIGFKHKEKYLAMKYNLNNLSKPDMVREAKVSQQF